MHARPPTASKRLRTARWRRTAVLGSLTTLLLLLAPLTTMTAGTGARAAACVSFQETGQTLCDRFLNYWNAHGGLAINGYPLTAARMETLEDGKQYQVQWFEQVRMEYHPEVADPQYQVLLGQFGRRIHPADPAVTAKPGQRFFPETGHNLGGDFLTYWTAQGGLAQFGYPLSEEMQETLDGKTYTVQYTERARFERHPENQPPYTVLLGQFGRLLLNQSAPPSSALPPLKNGTPYRDQFGRFITRYPVGWSVSVDSDRNVNFLAPQAPPAAGINVSPRPVTDDVTLDNYRQNDYDYLLPRLKDYRLISDTKIMVGPYNGYKRVFTHTNEEGQFEEIVRYHIRAKGYVIVVNCFTAPHDEGMYMPLFDGTTGAIEPL